MRTKRRMLVFLLASLGAFFLTPAVPAWACGKASFSPQSYLVGEHDGRVFLSIVLHMDQPETRTRKIGYQTLAGTAKSGADFVATSGTVAFSPGETSKTFAIDIVNDSTKESTERFEVKIKDVPATSCVEGGPNATVTITDEDPLPQPSPTRDEGSDPPPSDSEPDPSTGSDPGQVASDPSLPATETPTPTPTPSPADVESSPSTEPADVAASASFGDGGGLSAFALAGIAIGAIVIGSFAVAGVRRRFLATQPPS
jgi:hypothetical protein